MTRKAARPLAVRLPPALGEFLRREAGRRGISASELARQLLMRGLHEQRLDDVIRDLCPDCGANLNQAPCACASRRTDPRWSALKDLR